MDTGKLYDEALKLWRHAPAGDLANASLFESIKKKEGLLLLGENLGLMAALSREIESGARGPVNLVYMDPPYFTNRNLAVKTRVITPAGETTVKTFAFSDIWTDGGASGRSREQAMERYLLMLTMRIIAARELLADDGSLWIHLDHHAVHYAKVMADMVFGGCDYLVNEVIWYYKSGGSGRRRFSRKHDTLLFYAKNKKAYKFFPQEEKSYNRGFKPYRFKGVDEYRDEQGWYTVVNMKDVWEIPMVGRTAAERTGYATQKPEALLERIVRSCTEEGDVCLDPFGGSGTLAAACARLGRKWVYIDENPAAAHTAAARLGLYAL